jgi:hypothetical protein
METTGFMSRHVGPGIKRNGLVLSYNETKSNGFRSTFQDTAAYRMNKESSSDTKQQFMTTFHKMSADDMRRVKAKLENDHRVNCGAKNFYAPPSEHLFREPLDNDVYGRPGFQVRYLHLDQIDA